ncbi:unnamed protein product [Rotaria sordida]|nr:unnamed protein product [Rotaria sordida]
MNGLRTKHNINIAQGCREPALDSFIVNSSDPCFIQTSYNNYEQVMNEFRQFSGEGFAGDENCRQGFSDPRQATWNNGLCASMHAASQVTALVGPNNGIQVTIVEENEYPFDDTIHFHFQIIDTNTI